MKQRFSSLDVHVIAAELSSALVSLRVPNIYDLSSRIFLFKFAKPGTRQQLLVDSGFRCHLTSFTRAASSSPSLFVQKLRKYLKSKRVTKVTQVGSDRVVEILFSEGQYRLYLEFFAAGNVVLTDADLNVLALLRQVSEGDEDVDVKVGGRYVLEAKQNFGGIVPVTEHRLKESLEKAIVRFKEAQDVGGKKAKRAKGGDDLRKALSAGFPEYPAHLLEHVFFQKQVDTQWKITEVLDQPERMQKIMLALDAAADVYGNLVSGNTKGYIIAKTRDGVEVDNTATPSRDALLYHDFHPFRPSQFENSPDTHILEFDGFNKTVDEFYSSIESQKLESRLTEREQAAERKLETARNEHAKRIGALQQVQEVHISKAQAIEANAHRVEEASAAVNGLIGQGMDWVDIGKLIENEQGRGNVVAQMIKLPLKLEENTATLLLDEPLFDDEDDEEDRTDSEANSDDEDNASKISKATNDRRIAIEIDLALTPWQNARQYYDQKKQAAVKEGKTMQASVKALAAQGRKIQEDLKKGLKQEMAVLQPTRRQSWFEKFLWFISSDGYLVIGGKDAQQSELLYRRYLKKGDVYVHADLQGASSVIVKNNPQTPDAPIPPSTLSQAGALTVCTSSAWDSKAVMAAWWVNSDQVSKTALTGEYLQTGGFEIRGRKTFLPPSQLLLGLGVAWLISEDSRANHGKHRLAKSENKQDEEGKLVADRASRLSLSENEYQTSAGEVGEDQKPVNEDLAADTEEEVDGDSEAIRDATARSSDQSAAEEEGEEEGEEEEQEAPADSDEESERINPLQGDDKQDFTTPRDLENSHEESQADDDHKANQQDDDNDSSSSRQNPPSTSSMNASQFINKPTQHVRGKRTKAKRAAQKYRDQDLEDRQLTMQLLGSDKAAQKKNEQHEIEKAKKAKLEADKDRRRKQHQRAAEREKARHERLLANDAGGVENGELGAADEEQSAEQIAQERQEHADIDLLVPYPEPGDTVLAAIPVVAPWGSMGRHKYKVKLQPGSLKKGKAVREILGGWTSLGEKAKGKLLDETNSDKERPWAREIELLKGWRFEEVVGAVPVKGCRVMQSGGLLAAGGGGSGCGNRGKGGGGGGGKGKGAKKGR